MMPALLKAASRRPNLLAVRSTIEATSTSSVTSQRTAIASRPVAVSAGGR
jgi:hypothetical protein